jgi:hypothetical protein
MSLSYFFVLIDTYKEMSRVSTSPTPQQWMFLTAGQAFSNPSITGADDTDDLLRRFAAMTLNENQNEQPILTDGEGSSHDRKDDTGSGSSSPSGASNPRTALERTSHASNSVLPMFLNDSLSDCGLDEYVKLPKITVIGDQSSGKSSLIEAISQIKLPRDDGRRTECPMEIRLRTGQNQWSCRVALKLDHDVPECVRGKHIFAATRFLHEVERILKYAQWSILNAGVDHQPLRTYHQFLSADPPIDLSSTSQSFSRNFILVEVFGAPVNVTFMDLLGIITMEDPVPNPLESVSKLTFH